MANVTDFPFRSMIAKYGKPDVMWNEFVSADGLVSLKGHEHLVRDLKFSKKEKPIVAQLFTGHPEAMRNAAKLIAELGFHGLDINMGCPDRAIEKQGGGAGHIKDPANAVKVIEAAREGVKLDNSTKEQGKDSTIQSCNNLIGIPVTVKTRLGYNTIDWKWIRTLLELKLPALTVHMRTRKEMSDVPAHWELMPEVVKLRNEISPETLIIGNGDVMSLNDAREKTEKYGCDGVMIGRGIFGTPWLFEKVAESRKTTNYKQTNPKKITNSKLANHKKKSKINSSNFQTDTNLDPDHKSPEFRLKVMVEHASLYEKTYKGIKNFAVMKKHFKAYVSGWDGAKELRVKLMETEDAAQVKRVVREYLSVHTN